ncbi:MAG: DNA topoisomerase I [Candidatus Odinarchaeia archaeon]
MSTTLIITEKPTACKRIASALNDGGKLKEYSEKGVKYFEVDRNGEKLILVSALGHLYTVAQKGKGWSYPVFETVWRPSYEVDKSAVNSKSFIEVIKKLAKKADKFINACDYDLEGSLIGYSILRYACGENSVKKASRMKFSTLTKKEIIESFENASPQLDFNMIEAGKARHEIDWLFGINLTRALTLSLKRVSGLYKAISTGRVQGPTLKFIMEREEEIQTFVPTPYWVINAEITIGKKAYPLQFHQERIPVKKEAEKIVDECLKAGYGVVEKITRTEYLQNPPTPFDVGGLQTEAYRLFGYTPRRTLNIAERLYLDALISYPRTSSQKIPPSINVEEILNSLASDRQYSSLVKEILSSGNLVPNQGKKEDPAHPAIHPTGVLPERKLSKDEKNIYDLIVRRFLALFGEPAVKLTVKSVLDIAGHVFYLKGREIVKLGWIKFYEPYTKSEEIILPKILEGEKYNVSKIEMDEKYTSPPYRYNPSSLLKVMEKNNLGTKATRADIIETIFKRGYVQGQSIKLTELGFSTVNVLKKYCPKVLSIEMTREIEKEMESIQSGNKTREEVLKNAISILEPVLNEFKLKEEKIGAALSEALKKLWKNQKTLGKCPVCGTGDLVIIYSRKTKKRFVGCTNYRNGTCSTSFPLPQKGRLEPTNKTCPHCGYPLVKVVMSKRRPWNMCVNWLNCPGTKKE